MLTHLIVPLDTTATSFCYYANEGYAAGEPEFIPLDVLSQVVEYARAQDLSLNLLYGRTLPPAQHQSLIDAVAHVKIMPLAVQGVSDASVLVMNPDDDAATVAQFGAAAPNLILRVQKERLPGLSGLVEKLASQCQRMNVILLGVDQYTDADFNCYEGQLRALCEALAQQMRQGHALELSCLTDRLTLRGMHNCDAGLSHLTVSPEGRFYVCPGFYYSSADDSVGALDTGVAIGNRELLRLDHAPICCRCDAFHCKRCLFLNKLLTLEVNMPSHQQCVISHVEREASRQLLESLRDLPSFRELARIPRLDYLDPLEKVLPKPSSGATQRGDEELSDRELLWRIYDLQIEILARLRST